MLNLFQHHILSLIISKSCGETLKQVQGDVVLGHFTIIQ